MPLLFAPLIGRLGNLLFIYAHARAWAEQNGYELAQHPWVGEQIFDIPEAIRPNDYKPDLVWTENMRQNQQSIIYTRAQVRQWFRIRPELELRLRTLDKDIPPVLLNVRMGDDYRGAGLVTLSKECYLDAAKRFGYSESDCGYETDIEPTRLDVFQGDLSSSGLCTSWCGLPSFYRLIHAPVLFRANSTFSWWAATLGNGKVYAPVIKGITGGVKDQTCDEFVEGNWPMMAESANNSDLYLC